MNAERTTISNPKNIHELIRIYKHQIIIKVVILSGKEGDHFVTLAPSVDVSGYGRTRAEADQSFDENMSTFMDDIMKLSKEDRDREILKLGFKREGFKNKNFSKAYVDENGVLKNFEAGTLKKKMIETSFA